MTSALASTLNDTFLALLPKLQKHASIAFRYIRCPATRSDKIAETIALAWKWFVRLHERGKDISQFKMVFTYLVAKAVKCGRRITGMANVKDVMSERCQARHGFKVECLPTAPSASFEARYSKPHGQQDYDAFEERLSDNTVTPVPDAAAFRIDFPQWRGTRSERDRRLIDLLMLDTATQDAARTFGVSPGRVSQKRLEFNADWHRFQGEGMPGASC